MASAQDIVDILAAKGILNSQQVEKVRLDLVNTGKPVKSLIIENDFASEEDIVKAESELSKIPFVDLSEKAVSPQALGFIPRAVAEEYVVIPFDYSEDRNELSIAMSDPLNLEAVQFLAGKSKTKIIPFMAGASQIKEAIIMNYTQSLAAEVMAALGEVISTPGGVARTEIPKVGGII